MYDGNTDWDIRHEEKHRNTKKDKRRLMKGKVSKREVEIDHTIIWVSNLKIKKNKILRVDQ